MIIENVPMYKYLSNDKNNTGYFIHESKSHSFQPQTLEFFKQQDLPILDLTSDSYKIVFHLNPRIYHLLIDNLAEIIFLNDYFKIKKQKQNLEFILESSDIPHYYYNDDGPTFFKFFFKVLKDQKINYKIIHTSPKFAQEQFGIVKVKPFLIKQSGIKINNFSMFKPIDLKLHIFNVLSELYKKYLVDNLSSPTKIVFLTRLSSNVKGNVNERQKNEEKLIEFFKNKNCEIVAAEDFATFEDQINYFSSVKTLISVTGSGLLNMLMMPSFGNVVEIYTPVKSSTFNITTLTRSTSTRLHGQYRDIAWSKKHNHFSIYNDVNLLVDDLIKQLNDNNMLKLILDQNVIIN